ncbi:MAG: acetate--CoA ligase family protein [Thermoleophilia bacterium]|nr:acetate--CoA ligase family protein [Thermoleophilia bacterium]
MRRDLRPLFAPRSLAIVGASADPSKWGNLLARGALRGARRRRVFLVNRAGGTILGERALRSLAELPEPPELVVLAVPAAGFEEAVDEALAAGAKALVGISAGLGERDEAGRRIEEAVVSRVREAGAVLLGPNCLGLADAEEELDLGWSPLPAGPIGFVSQSGNLALEVGRLAEGYGLGFSRFASLGNQADLVASDFLVELAEHSRTEVIALYVEDFRDGRTFVQEARQAVDLGTPVVLLAGGLEEAGARAARSHTGALVSGRRAVEAACAAAGIVRVETPRQLVEAAHALLASGGARGRRVAVYADGGGHGVIAADLLAASGFQLPLLPGKTQAALRARLSERASVANPVDFAGAERDLSAYVGVGRLLLGAREVDAVLLTGYFGGWAADVPELAEEEVAAARQLAAAAAESGRALVVHTAYADSEAAAELRAGGVPTYGDVASAVRALELLVEREERTPLAPEGFRLAPMQAPPGTYLGARAFVAEAGIPMTEARPAETPEDALAAASALGYPVALKATELLHKSDVGGVALGLSSPDELAEAFERVRSRTGARVLSVEQMAPVGDGVELLVGTRRDPRFGPVVLVGLGGLYAELLDDVAVALVHEDDAARLLRSLRGAPLLGGARGRPPLDLGAAARAVAALSRAAAACPEVAELEVNPLLVLPDGVLGLDARVVLLA